MTSTPGAKQVLPLALFEKLAVLAKQEPDTERAALYRSAGWQISTWMAVAAVAEDFVPPSCWAAYTAKRDAVIAKHCREGVKIEHVLPCEAVEIGPRSRWARLSAWLKGSQ